MKPLVLCILDGVGIRKETHGNALYKANMPNFERLMNEYPHSLLEASGESVGLPHGQMGNSEVGHTNIGAGRIVYQPLELINNEISTGSFYKNDNILDIINYTKKRKSKLHIMGLLSDGGIHSNIEHLYALLRMCKLNDIDEVYLHLFMDGRDTLPTEALKYLNELNYQIDKIGIGKICTISGRYYAMDRDNNYDRLEKAYKVIVDNEGPHYSNYEDAIKDNIDKGITDEFTVPCVINDVKVEDNDGIIIFNFRPDRLRELGASLTNKNFNGFPHKNLKGIKLLTMMPVSDEVINTTAFELQKLDNTFGSYISEMGLKQLRIAETEKYAHVTYFFDGGVDKIFKGEKRTLISSPKVATYDMKPEMSAYKITSNLVKTMERYDVVILNFANGDMVGHTGNMEATIKALEVLDICLGKIYDKVIELGGTLVVTADHGNDDTMLDENDNSVTSHSTAKVPFIITKKNISLIDGKLGDIAPTLLTLLNLPIPKEMTGNILIKGKNKDNRLMFGKIFRIISILFIISFFTVYGGRFIYYYKTSHTVETYESMSFKDKLNTYNITKKGNGLYNCDDSKCFKGDIDNNYVYYKGITWRIISYNDTSIKLISEEDLTSLVMKYNDTNYVDKFISKYKTLINDSKITDISLLTEDEYNNSINDNTYLNNNTNYWLSSGKYVDNEGNIKDNDNKIYGVRLCITLSSDITILSGNGKISSSYRFDNPTPTYLSEASIGSYVKFSNYLWRIVDIDTTGVKLALESNLDSHIYASDNSSFNINSKDSIGYYLNNDFYNTLDTSKIVTAKWSVITYNEKNNYNYNKIYKTIKVKVGLLNIGDLFINDIVNYDLMTEDGNNVYEVLNNGIASTTSKNTSLIVRPAVYLNGSVLISGSGFINNPYVVGE